jgi:hypothetical protein
MNEIGVVHRAGSLPLFLFCSTVDDSALVRRWYLTATTSLPPAVFSPDNVAAGLPRAEARAILWDTTSGLLHLT